MLGAAANRRQRPVLAPRNLHGSANGQRVDSGVGAPYRGCRRWRRQDDSVARTVPRLHVESGRRHRVVVGLDRRNFLSRSTETGALRRIVPGELEVSSPAHWVAFAGVRARRLVDEDRYAPYLA